jgi:hypothetical protein
MKHLEKTNCKKIDINYYHAQTLTPKKNLKHARVNNPMMITTIGAITMLPTDIFHGLTATWEQGTVV